MQEFKEKARNLREQLKEVDTSINEELNKSLDKYKALQYNLQNAKSNLLNVATHLEEIINAKEQVNFNLLQQISVYSNYQTNTNTVLSQLGLFSKFPKILSGLEETVKNLEIGKQKEKLYSTFRECLKLVIWRNNMLIMISNQGFNENKQEIFVSLLPIDDLLERLLKVCHQILGNILHLAVFEPQFVLDSIRCIETYESQCSIERKNCIKNQVSLEKTLDFYPLGSTRRNSLEDPLIDR